MNTPTDGPVRILVIDDDSSVAASIEALLQRAGYATETYHDPQQALLRLEAAGFDVVLSDVMMPGMTGLELLARARRARVDVPVIFLTGAPKVEDTMRAMELGAFRYLAKPFERDHLLQVVEEAVRWSRLATAGADSRAGSDRAALEGAFERALAGLEMVYQPIVGASSRRVFGYEALMRSSEPALRSPPEVLDAAEKLGRLHELGRHTRKLVASQAAAQPFTHAFFVNLHSADLADAQLFDPRSPLSAHADSVVLELTERASLEGLGDVEARLDSLRKMGFRIAVDDLGAGYAGLSYFTRVKPEIVKIDMSLTRNIHADPVKRRVVSSMCSLAHELSMIVVTEGIETEDEFACVCEFRVDLGQGYLLGRPAPYPTSAAQG